MKARLWSILAMLALAFLTPGPALSQSQPPTAAQTTALSPQGLDQLVAPIALYPDDVLGQVLTAATYPLEVVEAARWREAPAHAALTGDALAAALAAQNWDPSVKALVPFPTILETMYERLSWTETLGDAFLSQPADVMDAIQRLRRRAEQTGTLVSTPDQTVGSDDDAVTIAPNDPGAIALPYYDPRLTYGTWPDPDAPPDYFMPPAGYVEEPGLFFFAPIVIIPVLRHLYRCDWHHHRLEVDVARFNAVDHDAEERLERPPLAEATWQHDPFHRHGVAYRDPALRAKFVPATSGGAETRRDFRGYSEVPAPQPGTVIQAGPEVRIYRPPANEQRQPTVFEGATRAPDVHAQAERGRQSLEGVPPPARTYAPRPAPRPAPPGNAPGFAPRR